MGNLPCTISLLAQLPTTLGQTTATGSLSVTLASSGTNAVTEANGASIASNTSTINSTLSAISGKLPSVLGQTTTTGSLSVVSDADTTNIGSHGNAWSNASPISNGTSTAIDCSYVSNISIFGTTSATTTFTIQCSQNNSIFYDSTYSITVTGAADFGASYVGIGAKYIRLKTSAAQTSITVTIAGKA